MFEALSSYPEHEGGELGPGGSTFFFDYPECEFNKIHVFEHTTELLVDGPMPTVVGSTSSRKIMTDRKEIQMFRKYSMLVVMAFAAMTSVKAATLNNDTYEYATVFIPNGGPLFVYSAVSHKGFHKQRVTIQDLNNLSDELGVAVPKGLNPDLEKLHSMLEQVGFKKVTHRIVYAGFRKVRSDNDLWQDVVHTKRFKQFNPGHLDNVTTLGSVDGRTTESRLEIKQSYTTRHEQDHKTGERVDIEKGPEAGHAYVFRMLTQNQ